MSIFLGACTSKTLYQETLTQNTTSTQIPEPGVTYTPLPSETPLTLLSTRKITPTQKVRCALGTGLRQETVELLLGYKDQIGYVMTASSNLAEDYFSEFSGSFRVIGAPSIASLSTKAARAFDQKTSYEALSYGLETGQGTPDVEWQNLILSSQNAQILANQYGKKLVLGPGFRLMSANEEKYPLMAPYVDIWMLQTQQLQKEPPGPSYRDSIEQIVNLIRNGHPDIEIWVQITLPPDREPNSQEWLAYYESIADLVDGVYLGVYTWSTVDQEILTNTMDVIFQSVCGNDE